MSWYKCFIVGENFPGAIFGESKPIGFYTTRFVEANSPEEAETKALANLKNEQTFSLPPGVARASNAKVYFENIEEVDNSEVNETNMGLSFFVMGT
jgi:hypothetical protein